MSSADIPSPELGWKILMGSILLWTATMKIISLELKSFNIGDKGQLLFYIILFVLSAIYLSRYNQFIHYIL